MNRQISIELLDKFFPECTIFMTNWDPEPITLEIKQAAAQEYIDAAVSWAR